jgi:hypothetical protein
LSRKAKTIPTLTPGLFGASSLFDKNCGTAANTKSHCKKKPHDQQDDSKSEAANREAVEHRNPVEHRNILEVHRQPGAGVNCQARA